MPRETAYPANLLNARELARRAIEQRPGATAEEIARHAISSLDDLSARLVAIDLMGELIANLQRSEVRLIEIANTRVVAPRATPSSSWPRREPRWEGDRGCEHQGCTNPALARYAYPECQFHHEERMSTGREPIADALSAAMYALIDNVRQQTRLDLTRELLDATFAVDGRTVTWGWAGEEDHERRIQFLSAHAAGTAATAARHAEALRLIREAGVACLNEVAA